MPALSGAKTPNAIPAPPVGLCQRTAYPAQPPLIDLVPRNAEAFRMLDPLASHAFDYPDDIEAR